MRKRVASLRIIVTALVLLGFGLGLVTAWTWVQSDARWRAHQDAGYRAGVALHAALQNGTAPSHGVRLSLLDPDDQANATNGDFRHLSLAPQAARTTVIPILADSENTQSGQSLTLVILSPDIVYPIAGLPRREGQTAAETTGEVFRLLASYCSDPTVVARMGDAHWVEINGDTIWSCDAAPYDLRLIAGLGALLSVAILVTITLNTSAHFTNFAETLRKRHILFGPSSYDTPGPQELQDIVASVNAHLERERAQLESRAFVLSGVSHDLGTPATRLRLRTALIADTELREKLEADIDSMTGMIESVLTYTRVEMNAEPPRKVSLTSLIDSIVADYQDIGHRVTRTPTQDVVVQGAHSVFMSRRGTNLVVGDRDIVVMARPISLERALCNLIDNALKYGRHADVGLTADSASATVTIADGGSGKTAREIEALMAPFKRGDNTHATKGYGLGLSIVTTIATVHGGSLRFEDTGKGLCALLSIRRN